MSALEGLPHNRSIPDATVIPVLQYADVRAAARWLCVAFGFRERLRIGSHRVQLSIGSGAIVVAEAPGATVHGMGGGHSIMVRVANADRHCERARRAGAEVVREPEDHPYGERQYSAVDVGGHSWTFTQTIADSDPTTWGGELLSDESPTS
jgi:uncharacterized glyoxalase superfamily protein PhnB